MRALQVAPVRERGLKYKITYFLTPRANRRSREGAWIEIDAPYTEVVVTGVAPVRERGLKLSHSRYNLCNCIVAPVRERGLKFVLRKMLSVVTLSLP